MKHRIVLAVWIFVFWTVIAALFAIQWRAYDSLHGSPWPWNEYIRWNMEQWYTWALLSPLVLWLATNRPIVPRRIWQTLPLHLFASAAIAVIAICIYAVLSHFINTEHQTVAYYVKLYLSKNVALYIATYWGLTAFAQMLTYYRENTKRQLREMQLEKDLAQAHLQVLQMQLHPHFLFNTLHAVGALIQEDPTVAEQMLLDLSSLLRVFLEGQASQEITLQRELHLVDLYMGIQQIRFRDRLTFTSLVSVEALDCSVPSLLLQPIVENAIVHGVSKNPGLDMIEIQAGVDGADLVIEVSNHNSTLIPGVSAEGSGFRVGLSNVKQRLAQIYGQTAVVELHGQIPHGVVCRITVPARKLSASMMAQEEALSL